VRLSTVRKTPKREADRLDVGIMNDVVGGGLVAGSVTLIGGHPGVGKTTLLMQVSDHVLSGHTKREDTVLFVQDDVMPKHRRFCSSSRDTVRDVQDGVLPYELLDVAERVGAEHMDRIELPELGCLAETLDQILNKVIETTPVVAVIDGALDRVLYGDVVVRRCLDIGRKVGTTFIIAHTWDTKGHNKTFNSEAAWAATCCLALEMDCESGVRMLYSTKNRNGPAPVEMKLTMKQGKLARM
jgi:archaellum biogenesis ATPase FlaH